jgi:hypothetical protein
MFYFFIFHVSSHGIEMIVNSDHIISWKLFQPFMRLFRHGIGISWNGDHVQGFIKVLFLRVNHCSKGKGTLENGLDNRRLERRPSLVNLRRFETPQGKSINGRWILKRWNHQMGFKKSSSREEGERPSSGVARQDMGKGFRMVSFQSVVRE